MAGAQPGTPTQQEAQVTITDLGLRPSLLYVAPGARVTFVNVDDRPHQIASTPYPTANRCPELNSGVLLPGEAFTAVIVSGRFCSYLDFLRPDEERYHGFIRPEP